MCTFIVSFEMTAGALWGLLRIEYVRAVFAHLGYPIYLGTILGIWKVPFALVLFLPGLQRLKECVCRSRVQLYWRGSLPFSRRIRHHRFYHETRNQRARCLRLPHICLMGFASTSPPPVSATTIIRRSRHDSVDGSNSNCCRTVRPFMDFSAQGRPAWLGKKSRKREGQGEKEVGPSRRTTAVAVRSKTATFREWRKRFKVTILSSRKIFPGGLPI
jgi:hypothetical protein